MRVLVIGSEGQLGFALLSQLKRTGHAAVGIGRALDISDLGALRGEIGSLAGGGPEVIFNAAAATDVDRCEREPAWARAANVRGPGHLAGICAKLGTRLVHISTDFVFDGRSDRPYDEEATPEPLSVYGRTKLEGELRVLDRAPGALVARTAWLYGGRGRNFVPWLLDKAAGSGDIRVATDQRGSPTYVPDLVEALIQLVEQGSAGLYHLANEGIATRFEFARAVLDCCGWVDREILPARLKDFKSDAPRPLNTALDCSRAARMGVSLRPWRQAVEAFSAGRRASE